MSGLNKIESGFPPTRELPIKKILLLRFSSLGDIILTTPLIKTLRQNYPDSRIDYCTKKSYSDILKYNPNINNIIEVSDELNFKELKELKKKLINLHYDLILDLHNNLRTFYLKLYLRLYAKILVFKKYSFRKFLLVKFKINLMKNLPSVSQRYIEVLKPTSFLNSSLGTENVLQPEIFTNEHSKNNVEKILKDINISGQIKLICIVPSSKHFTKTYPPEYYAELINKFPKDNYAFVLVGKGNDKENIDIIKSKTAINVYDLCDKLNLLELTELMKHCELVISGDTGPMHIAEAENIPIIMLAGSSVKEFGFFPPLLGRGAGSEVLEVNDLPCRPCSHIGRDSCPKGHFKCMKDITPEMVYEKLKLQLKLQ